MNDITQTKIIYGFEFSLTKSTVISEEEYFVYSPKSELFILIQSDFHKNEYINKIEYVELIYYRECFFERIIYVSYPITINDNHIYGYTESELQLDNNIFDSYNKAKKALLLK